MPRRAVREFSELMRGMLSRAWASWNVSCRCLSSSSFTVTPWRLGQVSKLEAQEFNNVLLSGPCLVIALWNPAVTPRTLNLSELHVIPPFWRKLQTTHTKATNRFYKCPFPQRAHTFHIHSAAKCRPTFGNMTVRLPVPQS